MERNKRSGAKPKFTATEDKRLVDLVRRYGTNSWNLIAKKFKNKTPRQCHSRYKNYVNPTLNHAEWTGEEDALLISKYDEIGPKWTYLASFFQSRSPNDVRYRWLRLDKNKSEQTRKEDMPIKQLHVEQENLIDHVFNCLKPEIEFYDPQYRTAITDNFMTPAVERQDHAMSKLFQFDADISNHVFK